MRNKKYNRKKRKQNYTDRTIDAVKELLTVEKNGYTLPTEYLKEKYNL